jgi:S1-C subfamily serine protease
MMRDGFLPRLMLVTLAAILVVLVWRGVPRLEVALREPGGQPRVVVPRGDLAADEQTTIAIFEGAKDSVVSITTESRVVDFWIRNAYDVPRGSGSGFIWDAQGHVVTNNHVVEGATAALVRLADGRAYPARLVGAAPEHDLAVLHIEAGPSSPFRWPSGSARICRSDKASSPSAIRSVSTGR